MAQPGPRGRTPARPKSAIARTGGPLVLEPKEPKWLLDATAGRSDRVRLATLVRVTDLTALTVGTSRSTAIPGGPPSGFLALPLRAGADRSGFLVAETPVDNGISDPAPTIK